MKHRRSVIGYLGKNTIEVKYGLHVQIVNAEIMQDFEVQQKEQTRREWTKKNNYTLLTRLHRQYQNFTYFEGPWKME